MQRLKNMLQEKREDIADLEEFHTEVTNNWANIELHRNIGHIVYAPAVRVDVADTRYTADWGVFEAAETKFKDRFEGNIVDLGAFRFSFLAFLSCDEANPYLFRIQVFCY